MALTLLVGTALLFGFAIQEHLEFKKKNSNFNKEKDQSLESKFKLFITNAEEIKQNK
jgi:hypothetical protein